MKRSVCMVLRLVAAGIIVIAGMGIGLEYVRHRMQGVDVNWWHCGLELLVIGGGVILFAKSGALAEKLTDDYDE